MRHLKHRGAELCLYVFVDASMAVSFCFKMGSVGHNQCCVSFLSWCGTFSIYFLCEVV